MKKIIILMALILIAIPITQSTYLFGYTFDKEVTKICPECDYWISCETNSMHPTFNCEDTLLAIEPIKKEIKVGDIIWFKGTKEQLSVYNNTDVKFIVHRIVGIDYKGCYITKGDNARSEDKYTPCYYDIKFVIKGMLQNMVE